jgi:hypothetical protein
VVAVPVSVTAFRGSRASRVYRITGSMNLEKGGKRMIDLEKRAKAWDEFSGEARELKYITPLKIYAKKLASQ